MQCLWQTKERKMQKMTDRLNETRKVYGMETNVKKTKMMVMGRVMGPGRSSDV